MMLLGAQTVTVRNYTTSGRDRMNQPVKTAVDVTVKGCAMQPISTSETVSLTDVETELWKCFLPPVAAALAVTTASEIVYNAMTFQVLGARPQVDLTGVTDHIAVDLKKQIA
jgi:hypothetical protein